jgi:hypothetical protein
VAREVTRGAMRRGGGWGAVMSRSLMRCDRGTNLEEARQLNVLECCDYADALGADAAEMLRAVVRGRG